MRHVNVCRENYRASRQWRQKLESCWLRRKFDFPQVSILKNVPKKFGQNLTLMTEEKNSPVHKNVFPTPMFCCPLKSSGLKKARKKEKISSSFEVDCCRVAETHKVSVPNVPTNTAGSVSFSNIAGCVNIGKHCKLCQCKHCKLPECKHCKLCQCKLCKLCQCKQCKLYQ